MIGKSDRARAAALGALALLLGLAPGGCGTAGERASPNIVFVMVDDLGWSDLGSYGSDFYETPKLDRLRAQGLKFTQAYANGPICAPTRSAFLSGRHYPNNPVYAVSESPRGEARFRELVPPPNEPDLPARYVTFAEVLRDAGYATAHLGKWHHGDDRRGTGPSDQGFERNVGGYATGFPSWRGGYFAPNENPFIDDAREGEYLTDYLSRKAVEFVEEEAEGPFLLHLAYYAVHTPLQAPEERIEPYREKPPSGGQGNPTYAAMVESVDAGVGRVLDALERAGVAERTVVFFYSDNGGVGGYREAGIEWPGAPEITDNAPLRGGKGMLYEGGVRVPLIVRWPGVVEPGSSSDEPVISTDFYPTFLELAGASAPPAYALDGESLLPLLRDPSASLGRDALYWHFPTYLPASWELGTWRTTPVGVIRRGRWKLLEFFETGRLELYQRAEHHGERPHHSGARPALAREHHAELESFRESVDAPMPTRRR